MSYEKHFEELVDIKLLDKCKSIDLYYIYLQTPMMF